MRKIMEKYVAKFGNEFFQHCLVQFIFGQKALIKLKMWLSCSFRLVEDTPYRKVGFNCNWNVIFEENEWF